MLKLYTVEDIKTGLVHDDLKNCLHDRKRLVAIFPKSVLQHCGEELYDAISVNYSDRVQKPPLVMVDESDFPCNDTPQPCGYITCETCSPTWSVSPPPFTLQLRACLLHLPKSYGAAIRKIDNTTCGDLLNTITVPPSLPAACSPKPGRCRCKDPGRNQS